HLVDVLHCFGDNGIRGLVATASRTESRLFVRGRLQYGIHPDRNFLSAVEGDCVPIRFLERVLVYGPVRFAIPLLERLFSRLSRGLVSARLSRTSSQFLVGNVGAGVRLDDELLRLVEERHHLTQSLALTCLSGPLRGGADGIGHLLEGVSNL